MTCSIIAQYSNVLSSEQDVMLVYFILYTIKLSAMQDAHCGSFFFSCLASGKVVPCAIYTSIYMFKFIDVKRVWSKRRKKKSWFTVSFILFCFWPSVWNASSPNELHRQDSKPSGCFSRTNRRISYVRLSVPVLSNIWVDREATTRRGSAGRGFSCSEQSLPKGCRRIN